MEEADAHLLCAQGSERSHAVMAGAHDEAVVGATKHEQAGNVRLRELRMVAMIPDRGMRRAKALELLPSLLAADRAITLVAVLRAKTVLTPVGPWFDLELPRHQRRVAAPHRRPRERRVLVVGRDVSREEERNLALGLEPLVEPGEHRVLVAQVRVRREFMKNGDERMPAGSGSVLSACRPERATIKVAAAAKRHLEDEVAMSIDRIRRRSQTCNIRNGPRRCDPRPPGRTPHGAPP